MWKMTQFTSRMKKMNAMKRVGTLLRRLVFLYAFASHKCSFWDS